MDERGPVRAHEEPPKVCRHLESLLSAVAGYESCLYLDQGGRGATRRITHITFPSGGIWLCVGERMRIFVSEHACDPQSDLEKLQHQSQDSWQLGNTLHSINNLKCASCIHNYKAVKEKHRTSFSPHSDLNIAWTSQAPIQQVGLQYLRDNATIEQGMCKD